MDSNVERTASCSCGQLRVHVRGEPLRVSICHCHACQRRTGSVFGTQARFARAGARFEGRSTTWSRRGESGTTATFHFCPVCGSTVYYEPETMPDAIGIPVGAFADPSFPVPHAVVYEESGHAWAAAVVPEAVREK